MCSGCEGRVQFGRDPKLPEVIEPLLPLVSELVKDCWFDRRLRIRLRMRLNMRLKNFPIPSKLVLTSPLQILLNLLDLLNLQ